VHHARLPQRTLEHLLINIGKSCHASFKWSHAKAFPIEKLKLNQLTILGTINLIWLSCPISILSSLILGYVWKFLLEMPSSHSETEQYRYNKNLSNLWFSIILSLFFSSEHISRGLVTVTDGDCRIYYTIMNIITQQLYQLWKVQSACSSTNCSGVLLVST
jgi:hypothetical protein